MLPSENGIVPVSRLDSRYNSRSAVRLLKLAGIVLLNILLSRAKNTKPARPLIDDGTAPLS